MNCYLYDGVWDWKRLQISVQNWLCLFEVRSLYRPCQVSEAIRAVLPMNLVRNANLSGNSGRSEEKCEDKNGKEGDGVGVLRNNFLGGRLRHD